MSFRIFDKGDPRDLPTFPKNKKMFDPALYRPAEGLINAVNVALNMRLPLLLTGKPGTGKTQLAHHLAWFFKLGEPLIFDAQTTSIAKDLFYNYDALGHFQYSQGGGAKLSEKELEKLYIQYAALGQAIKEDKKYIVLIDEIDKAPRDFPNDLLGAIERLEFRVPELKNKSYKADADNEPIIIITSNSEKNLPEAFLRRVAYYHIPFPSDKDLLEILQLKTDGFKVNQLGFILQHFNDIRLGIKAKLKKEPSTAELIVWTSLLQKMELDISQLNDIGKLKAKDKKLLKESYSVLAKNQDDLLALQKTLA